jgi:DNA polymerase-3 subunit epsilon
VSGSALEEEALRAWLRVPKGFALPSWAASRLCANVASELEARRGLLLSRATFGVLDLETTGLSPAHSRILEIGFVALRAGRVLARFETLVDVGQPVPSGITALTGIHSEMLEGAPSEAEALGQMAQLLGSLSLDALVAHNARFDRSFFARAWREHERPEPLPPFLCSVRAARRFVRAPRYGLDALIDHLSIPPRARHRALGDAEMTADLWLELIERARLAGVHTLESLRLLSEVGPPRRQARRRVYVVPVPA